DWTIAFLDVAEVQRSYLVFMPKKLVEVDPGESNARAQLAAILECSDDAIISSDAAGMITSWNKAAEGMFGYRPDESIGRPLSLLVPHDRLDEAAQCRERIRRGEQINHLETLRRRKNGSLLNVSLTVRALRDA